MDFLIEFLRLIFLLLAYMSPIILTLGLLVSLLGLRIGKKEGWSRIDSFYYAWITATTVGYGDMRPSQPRSKLLAILIALMGLILTGVLVASAVEALTIAFKVTHSTEQVIQELSRPR